MKQKKSIFKNKLFSGLIVILLLILLPIILVQVFTQQDIRQRAAEGDKPNIIIILTDDQRWDLLEKMPQVRQKLQGNGVTFTNSFAATPWCCPGRASILTGLYAHNHGVWTNHAPNGGFQKFKQSDDQTIAVWLKREGYNTGYFGKYLNEYDGKEYIPPGWNEWFAAGNNVDYFRSVINVNGDYKTFQGEYLTDLLTEKAINFIKN